MAACVRALPNAHFQMKRPGTDGKTGKKAQTLLDLNTFNIMICQAVDKNLCFLSRMVDTETGSSKDGTHVVHAFDCKTAGFALELQKAITQVCTPSTCSQAGAMSANAPRYDPAT